MYEGNKDYEKFLRDRITKLRIEKNLSERQLSFELGHCEGYINKITSGYTLPSIKEFVYICEYFGLTPKEFFDEEAEYPILMQKAIKELKGLDESSVLLIIGFINKLKNK